MSDHKSQEPRTGWVEARPGGKKVFDLGTWEAVWRHLTGKEWGCGGGEGV